jgi:hypothetical protein
MIPLNAAKFKKVTLDAAQSVTPQILPARILVSGNVAAVENEIRCFILDLPLAFLEDTTSAFLSVHVFMRHDTNTQMPNVHDIVSLKGRVLHIDENRVIVLLDSFMSLQ